jgi:hypothetical protein
MARNTMHSCTYFDDGELVCGCGTRAVYVLDEDTLELVLTLEEDDLTPARDGRTRDARTEELAVSA